MRTFSSSNGRKSSFRRVSVLWSRMVMASVHFGVGAVV
jgi:hypothetical protein